MRRALEEGVTSVAARDGEGEAKAVTVALVGEAARPPRRQEAPRPTLPAGDATCAAATQLNIPVKTAAITVFPACQ